MKFYSKLIFCGLLVLGSSCSRLEVVEKEQALRLSSGPDLNFLNQAVTQWPNRDEHIQMSISWLEKVPNKELSFGACRINAQDYATSLRSLLDKNDLEFVKAIHDSYDFMEVYGKDKWGEILLTSYYSPVIKGSKKPNSLYSQALYAMPDDLIMIDMKDFVERGIIEEELYSRAQLPAKIVYGEKGEILGVKPFFSRKEIDEDGLLKGKGLELAYVDPIDAFFLQIQGSGLIEFEDGTRVFLGYAAQNGHRYYSIGKSLFDIIPQEEMSKDKLVSYLRELPLDERNLLLFENPSYVFFRDLNQEKGQTTFGPPVIDKRTIAIDYRVLPMGALAFLDFDSPRIKTVEELKAFEVNQLEREGRFVLAHDSGGAIKGAGRADLFWGMGDIASYNAGVMRHRGKLWFLAPKACSVN